MELHTRNILVGSLLGDGWLTKIRSKTNTSIFALKYNDKSLEYLKWIRSQIMELTPSAIKSKPEYSQHYFYTKSQKDLGEFREIFYPNDGMKRVPENINELLVDPISLAVWYQDDGTLDRRSKYHWNAKLATYCFPYEDCIRLKYAIRQNFDIKISVCKCQMRGKMYYVLYVLSESMTSFIEVIKPYIHENHAYKIIR